MKTFDTVDFDYAQCRGEVAAFGRLLGANPPLHERRDILPFFRANRQLAALCGVVSSRVSIAPASRVAWEYDLFGEYACDLVVGDAAGTSYCFIEFEDATPNSLFAKAGKRAAREWSRRFEHGFSQLADWIQKLTEMAHNPESTGRFGRPSIAFEAALVIGRTASFDGPRELQRFEWRGENVVVGSKHVRCLTFDGLLDLMQVRLGTMEDMARVARRDVT